MTIRIYIAASMLDKPIAATLAAALRRDGHIVTSSWVDRHEQERDLTREQRKEICDDNLKGVRQADTLLYLHNPACRGALIELAMAWSLGKRIIAVGNPRDITLMAELRGIRWFNTQDEAIAELMKRAVA
jgi:nucleoside 2-deoxyribosyltransferase